MRYADRPWTRNRIGLFGGGAFGDTGAPRATSQLAILPGTSHVDLIDRAAWIGALVTPFLDAK